MQNCGPIMASSHPLNHVQRWMQAVITHPDGIGPGIASADATRFLDVSVGQIEQVILPSNEMSSVDRLQIYARAYFGRLIECLRAQFPAVRAAVGNEAFDGLAYGFLVQNPSTNYSLDLLGHSFDAFLVATRPPRLDPSQEDQPDFADFLIELAQLERIYSDVFNGRGPEMSRSLEPADFDGLSADNFAGCRLVPHACVRLLEFRFPVHEYASAIRQGIEATPPVARPVHLVVTRRNYVVRRFEVTREQFELLSSLCRQDTVGQSLETLVAGSNRDLASLATDLQSWFREWAAIPLFAEFVAVQ